VNVSGINGVSYQVKKYSASIRVQLGCFDQPAAGWYNTDITPHIFIARVPGLAHLMKLIGVLGEERWNSHKAKVFSHVHYLNLKNRFPFPSNSVEAFFSSHVLEHVYFDEACRLIEEIHRCLRPGGYVRFVLPDLEYALSRYKESDPSEFLEMVFENTAHSGKKNEHHWMYTSPYLVQLLIRGGFGSAREARFQETDYEPFKDLDNRPETSFFVEARK
jgi:SAM-dependent methyltransferase